MKLKEIVLMGALALPIDISGEVLYTGRMNLPQIQEKLGVQLVNVSTDGDRKVDLIIKYQTCGDFKNPHPLAIFDLRNGVYYIDPKLDGNYEKRSGKNWRENRKEDIPKCK